MTRNQADSTTVSAPSKRNHIAFCLDRSSSMNSLRKAAVAAFNDNLATIQAQQKAMSQPSTISLFTFANDVTAERLVVPADKVNELTLNEYRPEGMTALFDSVRRAIDTFQTLGQSKEDTSFVILVITDGAENASTSWDVPGAMVRLSDEAKAKKLAAMIRECEVTDKWTFAFLVPEGNQKALIKMGIAEGNIATWEQTVKGVAATSKQMSSAMENYFQDRAQGKSSSKTFFTDLKNLTRAEVQQELVDLSHHVKIVPIKSEQQIRHAAEAATGKEYNANLKGKCYYKLVKSELVQGGKQVVIRDAVTKRVYGGTMEQMRSVIGIAGTDGQHHQVRPGNHGNWEVFIQSTSVNRVLKPGRDELLILQQSP